MPLLDLFGGKTSGASARLPTSYQIKNFTEDANGVDDETTSTLTMLHNLDSVTMVNPFPKTKANFTMKTVNQDKTKLLGATTNISTSTKTEKFSLAPGETKAISVEEGHATVVWTGTERNQDIYVSLVSVDALDDQGNVQTSYTSAGQNLFGFDLQRQLTNWRNNKWLARGRGGKGVIMGGDRPRLFHLARPVAGGSGGGGRTEAPEGPSEQASFGIMDRPRPY